MAKLTFGRIARTALAVSALLGAAAAQSVEVKFLSTDDGMTSKLILGETTAKTYWVGDLNIQVRDDKNDPTPETFEAFCIDPYQSADTGYTAYTETTLSSTFSAQTIGKIGALFSFNNSYLPSATEKLKAAAFQLALWEVANDNGNLGTGRVQKVYATNTDLVTRAQGLLNGYSNYNGPSLYSFTFYQSASKQDFIVATSVPEPETYAMMLAGLGLMGAIARRRKAKAA